MRGRGMGMFLRGNLRDFDEEIGVGGDLKVIFFITKWVFSVVK